MILPQKIKLIDDLIREDPETTIADYIALLYEIETIEQKTEIDMNTPKHYTPKQAAYIIRHHRTLTVRRLSKHLRIPEKVIYNFGSRHNLTFVKGTYERKEQPPPIDKTLPVKLVRPPMEYSNRSPYGVASEYLQTCVS